MLLSKEILNENGTLNLSTIKCEKFKSSVITFSMTFPLTKKNVAYNLLLSGMLRRGSATYPSMAELNRKLDELYGSYIEIRSVHIGDNLSLTIAAEVLDNKYIPDGTDALGGVIDVVSDIIFHPSFKNTDFDKRIFLQEQNVAIDALAAIKNDTRSYSASRCNELMGEETSLTPTHEELLRAVSIATLEEMIEHYDTILSYAPLDVFYIGATDSGLIKEKILRSFLTYPCNCVRNTVPLCSYKRNKLASITEKMSVSQGKLTLGFSTNTHISSTDDSYYTAIMLNEIFGGSVASKLFLNVREKMGLCYYCSSSYSIYTGVITVSSGIEVNKLETVKKAILAQLDEISKGCISDYELNSARRSVLHSYRQLYDNPFDIQSFYSGRTLFDISDTIEDCEKKILQVSTQDISKLASTLSLDAVFFVEGTKVTADCVEDCEDD